MSLRQGNVRNSKQFNFASTFVPAYSGGFSALTMPTTKGDFNGSGRSQWMH